MKKDFVEIRGVKYYAKKLKPVKPGEVDMSGGVFIGKPVTVNQKNIGRIFKKAIKALKAQDVFIVFEPEEFYINYKKHITVINPTVFKKGSAGKFKLKRGIIKK